MVIWLLSRIQKGSSSNLLGTSTNVIDNWRRLQIASEFEELDAILRKAKPVARPYRHDPQEVRKAAFALRTAHAEYLTQLGSFAAGGVFLSATRFVVSAAAMEDSKIKVAQAAAPKPCRGKPMQRGPDDIGADRGEQRPDEPVMHPFLGMTVSVKPVQWDTAPAPAIGVRAAGQPPVLPGIARLGE